MVSYVQSQQVTNNIFAGGPLSWRVDKNPVFSIHHLQMMGRVAVSCVYVHILLLTLNAQPVFLYLYSALIIFSVILHFQPIGSN